MSGCYECSGTGECLPAMALGKDLHQNVSSAEEAGLAKIAIQGATSPRTWLLLL